ncbi:hypothetical protein [Streptomyces pseudogriseolus]|uniref:hypothetical protein n=1 Tax=Streptomyces pseudogriseolus TaxID=36817 RepID=UPI0003495200|nr:hypothetical protein [Streptomyces gancidicus]
MSDEIRYEHKTVQTVRGTDGLVISKMQKDGWEFVEQSQGTLRSTPTFRRPRKPVPWRMVGVAAAGLAILAAMIGTAVAREEGRVGQADGLLERQTFRGTGPDRGRAGRRRGDHA